MCSSDNFGGIFVLGIFMLGILSVIIAFDLCAPSNMGTCLILAQNVIDRPLA